MKAFTITLEEPTAELWLNLPPPAQQLLAERSLRAILNGRMFPSGVDKLELAIDLAEAGVDAEIISTLSHLDRSIFEGFMSK
jgi:hypothetical protein